MASVNSSGSTTSTYYSASGKLRTGIGGLASGLDTDELVKTMTLGTQTKISKQNQSKQLLSWKMDAYQSISSKLISFQDKYLSYTSTTNLYSQSFFNAKTVTASGENSKYISVLGTSNLDTDISIKSVDRLAVNASITTDTNISTKALTTGEINLDTKTVSAVQGEKMNITYGGKSYTIKIADDADVSSQEKVVEALNKALENVEISDGVKLSSKVSFSSGETKTDDGETKTELFFKTSDDTTATIGTGSSLLFSALGVKSGATSSDTTAVGSISDTNLTKTYNFKDTMAGKNLTFSYNGKSASVSFTKEELDGISSMDDFRSKLEAKLDKTFGSGNIKVATSNGTGTFGSLSFTTKDDTSIFKFVQADSSSIYGKKGVFSTEKGSSNRINTTGTIGDANTSKTLELNDTSDPDDPDNGKFKFNINGEDFTFAKDTSITDMLYKINNSEAGVTVKYLETIDAFTITSNTAGEGGKVEITDVKGNLANALFSKVGGQEVDGQDAQITVSYGKDPSTAITKTITRNSNTFSLDGLEFTVNGTFDAGSGDVKFNSTVATDSIVNAVKSMINDYNDLITAVNTELTTKRNRDYAPLTDDQKKEMSESEINAWEEKAKQGMLFGDSTLSSLSQELRFAFSFNLNKAGDLSEYGITTSSSYSDNGKIVFDENAFVSALKQDPEKVAEVFASSKTDENDIYSAGVMTRVKSIYDKYASTTGAAKGILIEKAGVDGSITETNSTLYKQITSIEDLVEQLKDRLESEEDRYYSKFTQLERLTSQMNSQSSWLSNLSS